jgi:hypothetical protein
MNSANPRPIHLVGSVPLGSAAEVFEQVSDRLESLISRIPDGETGERLQFIGWQEKVIQSAAGLQPAGEWQVAGKRSVLYGLASGVAAPEVTFGALGYADAAKASFAAFKGLRNAGRIVRETRMQVSLPTPLTVLIKYAARDSLLALWPVYEARMRSELDAILRAIPHELLAIQWDVAPEVHTLLEQPNSELTRLIGRSNVVAAIARITDHVPAGVDVGWHLCYGDSGHRHIVEPHDMSIMVELANDLSAATQRAVNWIHMPVPKDRHDAAYFAPLKKLDLRPGAIPMLGLIHMHDGLDGARSRAAAACKVLPWFGVATECGLGRRAPESIPELLNLHREVALTV